MHVICIRRKIDSFTMGTTSDIAIANLMSLPPVILQETSTNIAATRVFLMECPTSSWIKLYISSVKCPKAVALEI